MAKTTHPRAPAHTLKMAPNCVTFALQKSQFNTRFQFVFGGAIIAGGIK